jgi:hypothetical protein
MQDKNVFDPEKITIVEVKTVKVNLDTPENFNSNKVRGHLLNYSLQLGFNVDEQLIRADFTVYIQTESNGKNLKDAIGNFHFVFIYFIENLKSITTITREGSVNLSSSLGNAIASVTYGTARGLLLMHVQGTVFQNFVLPVVSPNKLLAKNEQ